MSTQTKKSPFEVKVEAMEKGFSNFPLANVQLEFRREALTPAQVVQRLQGMVMAIQEERDTDAKHKAAATALEKQMPRFEAFYEEAIGVLMKHFGSDPRILATFGLRPQRAVPAPEVIIVERAPVERVVEVREEVEVPGRGRGGQVDVDQEVTVGGRGGERVEVETRVGKPVPRSRPHPTRHPGRGSRR